MGWTYYATLGVVLVAGLVLILGLYGRARAAERDADRRYNEPPSREIPGFWPDTVRPAYLSELESRQEPEHAISTDLADAERDALRARLADADPVPAGWVLGELATDRPSGWAVLDAPVVAVLTEGAASIRELLPVVERAGKRPLVVVGTELHDDVVDTLRAVKQQRLRQVLVVLADADACADVCEQTGATPLTRASLQSGWVPPESLGACARWVSASDASWIIAD